MCGIAGIINFKETDSDFSSLIVSMCDSLRHRGPDGEGQIWFEDFGNQYHEFIRKPGKSLPGGIVFGHRRLSILDLTESAHQPLCNENKTVWVVFNGEIFNYLELGEELKKCGHSLKSSGDTEIIVHAWEEWGEECFSKFNGMWAIALYDIKQRRLILSRDRYGIKPLYYFCNGSFCVFASEIKAVLLHPDVPKAPNFEKVCDYIVKDYRHVDSDCKSFYQGINQVPPAHWAEVKNGEILFRPYWSLDNISVNNNIPLKECEEKLYDLFKDSVKLRLRSDVPVTFALSGGLDSGAILNAASEILNNKLEAFSACYKEKTVYDERKNINISAKRAHAVSRKVFPSGEHVFEDLLELIKQHDEPLCTVTWYSHWQVVREIHEAKYKVMLAGHAADELLFGYYDHFLLRMLDLKLEGKDAEFRSEYDSWLKRLNRKPEEWEDFFNKYKVSGENNNLGGFFRDSTADYSKCLNSAMRDKHLSPPASYRSKMPSLVSRRANFEFNKETVPAVLRPDDRNTMAFSIESRLPFLDYRLVEFCFSIPDEYKIHNGYSKYIQRKAFERLLPRKIVWDSFKVGFNAPSDLWFKGKLGKEVIRTLDNSRDMANFLNINNTKELFQEHNEGIKDHKMFGWRVLNFSLWMKQNWQ